jgi:formylglycine-generating enzyme required for sulfatase activity
VNLSPEARFYRVIELAGYYADRKVWIRPGTFVIGSPEDETDRLDREGPQTTVTISRNFWIGKYEVTQQEWGFIVGINPSLFNGVLNRPDPIDYTDPMRPVENVNWVNAVTYCAWRTRMERQAGRIATNWVYRLPTEAEWEYACRAGTATRFSYGDDPDYTQLASYAWYGESVFTGSTHPVGQKLPNPWGLYDMEGNVSEWCQDWYDAYPGGTATDPTGPATGSTRVIRGGSWARWAYQCRSGYRYYWSQGGAISDLGFRVVLAPE